MIHLFKPLFKETRLISIEKVRDDVFSIISDSGPNTIITRRIVIYKGQYGSIDTISDKIIFGDTGKKVNGPIKRLVKSCRGMLNNDNGKSKIILIPTEFASIEAKLNKLGL